MVNKLLMHSDSLTYLNDMVYKKVFHNNQLRGDEKVIAEGHDDETKTYYKGFELKDFTTKKVYFVKSDDVKDMPFVIDESNEVWYRGKVYHLVIKFKSVKITELNKMDMKDFVDILFPLNHTHSDDLLVAKLMILTNTISKSFFRISSINAFGKDGIANSIIQATGKGNNVSKATTAKLATLIDDWFTVFNEISGFQGEAKEQLQDFLLNTGDPKNNTYQHKSVGSDKTFPKYDTSQYGYTIIHNLPNHYFDKGQEYFDTMFTEPVFFRFMPVLLQGQVQDRDFVNAQFNSVELVSINMDFYKNWVGKWIYLRNHWNEIVMPYDVDKYDLSYKKDNGERWFTSFLQLAKLVYLYTGDNKDRFYEILDLVYQRNREYLKEVEKYGLFI